MASENDGGIDSGNKSQEKSKSTGYIDKIKKYGVGILARGLLRLLIALEMRVLM
ncbi:hypothetical protein [Vibrio hepatarius]|uniref:hypothetical protein n=1 Tax=Vibrio hepatarius TaxID=171383 RepID=UPI001C08D81B|nr:hypothetical protein [Vibrio hepatarius]MBU2898268.1 hypothetical protein [Vibrio hepatarius]